MISSLAVILFTLLPSTGAQETETVEEETQTCFLDDVSVSDIMLPGETYTTVNARECLHICKGNDICVAYSWDRVSYLCTLLGQSSKDSYDIMEGTVGGFKDCDPDGCFLNGYRPKAFPMTTFSSFSNDALSCLRECQDEDECFAYAWHKTTEKCSFYAYDALYERVVDQDYISGGSDCAISCYDPSVQGPGAYACAVNEKCVVNRRAFARCDNESENCSSEWGKDWSLLHLGDACPSVSTSDEKEYGDFRYRYASNQGQYDCVCQPAQDSSEDSTKQPTKVQGSSRQFTAVSSAAQGSSRKSTAVRGSSKQFTAVRSAAQDGSRKSSSVRRRSRKFTAVRKSAKKSSRKSTKVRGSSRKVTRVHRVGVSGEVKQAKNSTPTTINTNDDDAMTITYDQLACAENNVSYEGGEITNHKDVLSAEECMGLCETSAHCTHWTWMERRVFMVAANKCSLKKERGSRTERRGVISGPKRCGSEDLEEDAEFCKALSHFHGQRLRQACRRLGERCKETCARLEINPSCIDGVQNIGHSCMCKAILFADPRECLDTETCDELSDTWETICVVKPDEATIKEAAEAAEDEATTKGVAEAAAGEVTTEVTEAAGDEATKAVAKPAQDEATKAVAKPAEDKAELSVANQAAEGVVWTDGECSRRVGIFLDFNLAQEQCADICLKHEDATKCEFKEKTNGGSSCYYHTKKLRPIVSEGEDDEEYVSRSCATFDNKHDGAKHISSAAQVDASSSSSSPAHVVLSFIVTLATSIYLS